MTSIRRLAVLFVVPVTLAGCGSAGDASSGVTTTRDSAGVTIALNHPATSTDTCTLSADPFVEIGTVTGAPEYQLFHAIDGVVLPDGRIAIVNSGTFEIRIYDESGRFLSSFGREGRGPGEFNNVAEIWHVHGDTLAIGDWDPWRALYFLADGTVLGTATPRPLLPDVPRVSAVLADGSFILGTECCPTRTPAFADRTLHLVHYARSGSVIDTIGAYPNGRMGQIGPLDLGYVHYRLFEAHTEVAAAGQRIAMGHASEREVSVRRASGELERLIRWTGPDRTVRPEELDAFEDRIRALAKEPRSPRGRAFTLARIADNRPVNDTFPAYSALRLDRSGDLWVRRFAVGNSVSPYEMEPDRWFVFARDGAFLCHASTPAGFRVFDIGEDYVLSVVRDELDVEYVRLHSLRRPAG